MAEGTLSSLGRSVLSSSWIFLQNPFFFYFTHTFCATAVLAFLLISFGPISEKLFQCQRKSTSFACIVYHFDSGCAISHEERSGYLLAVLLLFLTLSAKVSCLVGH